MSNQLNALLFFMLTAPFFGCMPQKQMPQTSDDLSAGPITIATAIQGTTLERMPDASLSRISVENDGTFHARDSLFNIIAYVAPDEIVMSDATLPDGHFMIDIAPPESPNSADEHIRSKLRQLLADAFELTFESVNQKRPVLLLVDTKSGRKNVSPAKNSDSRGWGTSANGYEFRNQSIGDLADFLGNEIGEIVFDDTNDSTMYNFELPVDVFDRHDPNSWTAGLKSIGLKLKEGKRAFQFTLIKPTPGR